MIYFKKRCDFCKFRTNFHFEDLKWPLYAHDMDEYKRNAVIHPLSIYHSDYNSLQYHATLLLLEG